jgi:hypothetical protein
MFRTLDSTQREGIRGSGGKRLLMPDQHIGAWIAGDHDYRIKHLP